MLCLLIILFKDWINILLIFCQYNFELPHYVWQHFHFRPILHVSRAFGTVRSSLCKIYLRLKVNFCSANCLFISAKCNTFLSRDKLLNSYLSLSVTSEEQTAFDKNQVASLSEDVNKQFMCMKNTLILFKPNLQWK